MTIPASVEKVLLPHQKRGLKEAAAIDGAILISAATGTGKTKLALAIGMQRFARPLFMFWVPNKVLGHKQVGEFAAVGLKARLIDKPADLEQLTDGESAIFTYNAVNFSLRAAAFEFASRANVIILDESHHLKGDPRKVKRCAGLLRIIEVAKAAGRDVLVLLLTATPIKHNPMDLVNQWLIAGEKREAYQLRQATQWEGNDFGMRCVGWKRQHRDQVRAIVRGRRIHATKEEVFAHLPPMIQDVIMVEISEAKLRRKVRELCCHNEEDDLKRMIKAEAIDAFIDGGSVDPSPLALRVIQATLEASAVLKAAPVADYVADLVDSDEQVVVFGMHVEPLQLLMDGLEKRDIPHAGIHVGVPVPERTKHMERFKAGELKVLAATYATAGVGLDLHCARRVVLLENCWDPAAYTQAIGRVLRVGQKHSTFADTMIAAGGGQFATIEQAVLRNRARKIEHAEDAGFVGTLATQGA